MTDVRKQRKQFFLLFLDGKNISFLGKGFPWQGLGQSSDIPEKKVDFRGPKGDEVMEKKKLLIFAHYYHPDVASTGQILKDQAEGMLNDYDVTVVCTVPSYGGTIEEKYKTHKFYYEEINGVRVIRVRVPEFTKESKKSRMKNIISYYFSALKACRRSGKQDYIFTISQPPILGGLLGVRAKRKKHAKLIYCIQDFNPEQIMAVNYSKNKLILKLMMVFDKYSCKHSDLVITVGRDLVETLKKRFKNKKVPNYAMINNWIDEKEIYPLPGDDPKVMAFKKKYGLENKFVMMYSGNIGLYYDLENLIKVIEKFPQGTKTPDGKEVVFAFIGAGTVLEKLKDYVIVHNMKNAVFIPYQRKEDLVYSLNAGHVHWCVNAKGIKGVSCPSKAYGIMAVGKPVLGVLESDTEVRTLIEDSQCGLCCEPGDYDAVAGLIHWYIKNAATNEMERMGQNGRNYLENNLTRALSIQKYLTEINKL